MQLDSTLVPALQHALTIGVMFGLTGWARLDESTKWCSQLTKQNTSQLYI